jgi:hypothetical protein
LVGTAGFGLVGACETRWKIVLMAMADSLCD